VGIRRTFAEDLYVVMPSNDPSTVASQVAPLQVVINPLVNWIWLGFGVLAFGTIIALLPERAFSFAMAKSPAEVAATSALTLALLLVPAALPASAQDYMAPVAGVDTQTSYYPRSELEAQLQHEIVCLCPCGKINIAECRKDPCGVSHEMRGELAKLIDEGKTHDEILTAFVTKYGSEEMLAKPTKTGFNLVAWTAPWVVGGAAALLAVGVAFRWSRRKDETASEPVAPTEPELDERLDDELRNLD
jgi:cytochrome c-type biogenesis protein CcmH/NrfF